MIPGLVSIVITTFNRAHMLEDCIRMLSGQTYPHYEVVIIDDGSSDNTKEVVERLIDQYRDLPGKIHYFYQPNTGLSTARNSGIRKASGEFIQMLDSDDFLAHNKIELQVARLQSDSQIDAVYGDFRPFTITKKGVTLHPVATPPNEKEFISDWLRGNYSNPGALLWRAKVFATYGFFNEELSWSRNDDGEFAIRMAALGCRFGYCKNSWTYYQNYGAKGNSLVRSTSPLAMQQSYLSYALIEETLAQKGLLEKNKMALGIAFYEVAEDASFTDKTVMRESVKKYRELTGKSLPPGSALTKMVRMLLGKRIKRLLGNIAKERLNLLAFPVIGHIQSIDELIRYDQ